MSEARPHVLIVGGAGTFGSRLARLLAKRRAYRVTLAGRDPAKAVTLQATLRGLDAAGGFDFATLDRDTIDAERLSAIGAMIVVDCAGPFRASGTGLVEAAIEAGCHYVDLADSWQFVATFRRFDAAAKGAKVTLVTGASSTPALSHAVVEHLTAGWMDIDSVDVAIVPGNTTPKGRSVIAAILSWVGRPLKWFAEGRWQVARGWGESGWVTIEGLGRRRAALANVPDLELLHSRFRPRVRAGFRAGMELGILHGLIGLAGLAVRMGIVKSARVFAGIGTTIAEALDKLGSNEGGMVVEAAGRDARGEAHRARWSLKAVSGDGPFVPAVPAATLVAAITKKRGPEPGAHVAAGLLGLDDIMPWFEGLRITTKRSDFHGEVPLFRKILGPAFDKMPAPTKRLHRGRPAILADGVAEVTGAEHPLGATVARWFGLPEAGAKVPLRVVIEAREGREYWTRYFDGKPMRSVMRQAGAGVVEERFGPVAMRMRLVAHEAGLDMLMRSGRFAWLPLPRFLLPTIRAEERAEETRHLFDVEIRLPFVGRLVAYRGYLRA